MEKPESCASRLEAALREALSCATTQPPRCLVAFSGGADSVALLDCAHTLARNAQIELYALHVHHGIRGAEADRDAAFCRDFCQSRNVPFFLSCVDAPAFAKAEKIGMEEAARTLRYREIESVCEKVGAQFVLTAHHLDDQLETVLLRLTRGTSPQGLCGISKRRERYLRPFLDLPKQDLIAYCAEKELSFVEDSTNELPDCPRNYLRQMVLPVWKELQPNLAQNVLRLVDQLRQDEDYMQAQSEAYGDTLDRKTLIAMPLPLLRRALVRAYYQAGATQGLQTSHVQAMVDLLSHGKTGKQVSLPNGFCARLSYDRLLIEKRKPQTDPCAWDRIPLQNGWNRLPNETAIFLTDSEKEWKEMQNIYKLAISERILSDKIVGTLYVRQRQEKDTCLCRGKRHTFKHLAQEAHADERQRKRLCVVCDDAQILWIPFLALCDDVNAKKECGACRYLLFLSDGKKII